MQGDARDLAYAGYYLGAVGAVLAALTVAGVTVVKSASDVPLFGWVTSVLEFEPASETRLSQAVLNSQEIRATLRKPIAAPAPLPPITAKIAIGHLLPGSRHAAHANRPKLSNEAFNAMAMDVPQTARAYAPPDQHRIY